MGLFLRLLPLRLFLVGDLVKLGLVVLVEKDLVGLHKLLSVFLDLVNTRVINTRVAGIEPTHVVLKTTVLPLNYTPLLRIGLSPATVRSSNICHTAFKKKACGFRSPLLTEFQLI